MDDAKSVGSLLSNVQSSASSDMFARKKKRQSDKDKEKRLTWDDKEKLKAKERRKIQRRLEVFGKEVKKKPESLEEKRRARALHIKMSSTPFLPASMFPPVLNPAFGGDPQPNKPEPAHPPSSPGSLGTSPDPKTKKKDPKNEFGDFVLPFVMQDAETKQAIAITKSRWSWQEGRVNMDLKSILASGTGRMNIFKAPPKVPNELDLSCDKTKSDLVSDYMKQGPLKILFHRFWNAKANEVIVPEKYRDLIAEENFDEFAIKLALQRDSANHNRSSHYSSPSSRNNGHDSSIGPDDYGIDYTRSSDDRSTSRDFLRLHDRLAQKPASPNYSQDRHIDMQHLNQVKKKDTQHHPDQHDINNPDMVQLMVGLGIGIGARDISSPNRDLNLMQHHLPVHHYHHDYFGDHNYNANKNVNLNEQNHSITNHMLLYDYKPVLHDKPHTNIEEVLDIEEKEKLQIPDAIALENEDNWDKIEEKLFDELYGMAQKYEKNKTFTHELPINYKEVRLPSTDKMTKTDRKKHKTTLKHICRDLVQMKVKAMREIVQAVDDEDTREKERIEAALNCPQDKQKDLMVQHEKHRHEARIYLRSLQHDNEVVFVRKMNEFGWLW